MMRKTNEQKRIRRESGLSCRQVAKDLQTFLDSELSSETASQLERHLELCRECGLEADAYRAVKVALKHRPLPIDASSIERLRAFGQDLVDSGDTDA